jgi:hypothetical protein
MALARGGFALARGGMALARGRVALARGGMALARGGMALARGGVALARGGTALARGGTALAPAPAAGHRLWATALLRQAPVEVGAQRPPAAMGSAVRSRDRRRRAADSA